MFKGNQTELKVGKTKIGVRISVFILTFCFVQSKSRREKKRSFCSQSKWNWKCLSDGTLCKQSNGIICLIYLHRSHSLVCEFVWKIQTNRVHRFGFFLCIDPIMALWNTHTKTYHHTSDGDVLNSSSWTEQILFGKWIESTEHRFQPLSSYLLLLEFRSFAVEFGKFRVELEMS